MDIYVVGFGGSKYIGEKEKMYIYIYICIDVRRYVYNVVDGVIGSIKGNFLVGCTHKCWKYKWKWNGGIHGYT